MSGISNVGGGCSANDKAKLLLSVIEWGGACVGATVEVEVFVLGLERQVALAGRSVGARMSRDEVVHDSRIWSGGWEPVGHGRFGTVGELWLIESVIPWSMRCGRLFGFREESLLSIWNG